MIQNDDGEPSRIKHLIRAVPHKLHAVSEFCHLGYFATAAGIAHEFHSLFAGMCGVALLIVLVLNMGAGDA